ncbi:MAG: DUF1552 domain-containing protein [Pseudomonadota bacterium]
MKKSSPTSIAASSKNSRRRFLKGLGVSLALPLFETFSLNAFGMCTGKQSPRFIGVYMPCGVLLNDWYSLFPGNGATAGARTVNWQSRKMAGENLSSVIQTGNQWNAMPAIQPINSIGLKSKISLYNHLSNQGLQMMDLNNSAGSIKPYDGGEHPVGGSSYLSCTGCRNTGILNGTSIDQVIAEHYKEQNLVHSIQLSSGMRNYAADGILQIHSERISWNSTSSPLPYVSPAAAFQRYFNVNNNATATANQKKSSILDFIRNDATQLNTQLSYNDRQRLDQYLTSVRAVEQRIQSTTVNSCSMSPRNYPNYNLGDNFTNYDRGLHIDLMFEIMALAAQCNITNSMSYMIDHERSEFDYFIDNKFHSYHGSQHGSDEGLGAITHYHMQRFANFIKTLDGIQDLNGMSALDNSVVMIGSGLMGRFQNETPLDPTSTLGGGDYTHKRSALPLLFAGSGGGRLKTDQHVALPALTKLSNCYQTLINEVYCLPQTQFANSDGIISEMLI